MKKIYFFALFLCASVVASAQVAVTFSVDLNNEAMPSADGVHIAGNFGDTNPAYPVWDPAGIEMMDMDMDGVYEVTLDLLPGTYEYKFINGNDWPMNENVPAPCQVGGGNSNREITVAMEAMSSSVCFGSCAACNDYAVLFRVDMSTQPAVNPNGVHVAGSFQEPVWQAGDTPLVDEDGDGVWEALVTFGADKLDENGNIEFKYINGNTWDNSNEDMTGQDCAVPGGNNRQLAVTEFNMMTESYCFATCATCTAPTMVTFQVDMSLQTVSPNGVHVAGAFQTPDAWQPGATEMTDDDADGIYEVTVPVAPGNYGYKFINGNNWDGVDNDNEAVPGECATDGNRLLVAEGEAMTVTFCYNQCTAECVADPDPEEITFRVDMTEETVDAAGVWLIGGFTSPQWQAGANQMTDLDADGIYEVTLTVDGSAELQYKFTNGDPYPNMSADDSVSETGDFLAGGCGISNGLGAFNRTYLRDGSGVVLDAVCYNSCAACIVSVDEVAAQVGLNVYPNPSTDVLNITMEDASLVNAIQLVSQLGQVVFGIQNTNVSNNAVVLDMNQFAAGFYTLSVFTDKGVVTQKVIKK